MGPAAQVLDLSLAARDVQESSFLDLEPGNLIGRKAKKASLRWRLDMQHVQAQFFLDMYLGTVETRVKSVLMSLQRTTSQIGKTQPVILFGFVVRET